MTGRYRRVAALICFVCCVLCSTLSVTAAVADQEKRHVIKVGYIDYDGFITEEGRNLHGLRCGIPAQNCRIYRLGV